MQSRSRDAADLRPCALPDVGGGEGVFTNGVAGEMPGAGGLTVGVARDHTVPFIASSEL